MKNIIKPNCFYDSIFLMQLSEKLSSELSCKITLMMGTEANKMLLKEQGLLTSLGQNAKVNDLIICCPDNVNEGEILELITKHTFEQQPVSDVPTLQVDKDIYAVANLVSVSIPGEFVYYEVKKIIQKVKSQKIEPQKLLLNHKMCIFIFSDNVPIEEEVKLKQLAKKNNVLIMGPDCGTAIINGIGLGFANKVRTVYDTAGYKSGIGIISAGGTGLQAITSMIHNCGGVITQGIGTGSRDLSDKVGGVTTIESIKFLESDPTTKCIIIFSKQPSKKVVNKLVNYITAYCKKQYILSLIGFESNGQKKIKNVVFAETTEAAVEYALKHFGIKFKPTVVSKTEVEQVVRKLKKTKRKYVRGLYSGGSLCDEAMLVLKRYIGDVYSNTPLNPNYKIPSAWESCEHTIIDLGDDIYTRGKPHPMIDFSFRKERLLKEAQDKSVAVIMFDIVLGFGANPDPVKELLAVIKHAKKLCNNEILFCAVIVGTELDPQNVGYITKSFSKSGVLTFNSNVAMAKFVGEVVKNL